MFAKKIVPAGQLQFQVADAVLTGTAVAGVVQPSMDVATAKFSRNTPTLAGGATNPNYAGGNIVITSNLSSNLTNLTVNLVAVLNKVPAGGTTAVPTIIRETKATFTNVNGSVTWTQAITGLTLEGTQVATSANGTSTSFEFVASSADGSIVTTRVFTALLAN